MLVSIRCVASLPQNLIVHLHQGLHVDKHATPDLHNGKSNKSSHLHVHAQEEKRRERFEAARINAREESLRIARKARMTLGGGDTSMTMHHHTDGANSMMAGKSTHSEADGRIVGDMGTENASGKEKILKLMVRTCEHGLMHCVATALASYLD